MPIFERPPLDTLVPAKDRWPAAFEAIAIAPKDDGTPVRKIFKRNVEQTRMP